jgi:hypothetical protein
MNHLHELEPQRAANKERQRRRWEQRSQEGRDIEDEPRIFFNVLLLRA